MEWKGPRPGPTHTTQQQHIERKEAKYRTRMRHSPDFDIERGENYAKYFSRVIYSFVSQGEFTTVHTTIMFFIDFLLNLM
jgi:hypothetical protein